MSKLNEDNLEPDYEAMWKALKIFISGYILHGKIDRHCGNEVMMLIEEIENGDLKKPKIPDKYINPHAKDVQIRDQGERGCSVGISTAYAYEMMKKREEHGNV